MHSRPTYCALPSQKDFNHSKDLGYWEASGIYKDLWGIGTVPHNQPLKLYIQKYQRPKEGEEIRLAIINLGTTIGNPPPDSTHLLVNIAFTHEINTAIIKFRWGLNRIPYEQVCKIPLTERAVTKWIKMNSKFIAIKSESNPKGSGWFLTLNIVEKAAY